MRSSQATSGLFRTVPPYSEVIPKYSAGIPHAALGLRVAGAYWGALSGGWIAPVANQEALKRQIPGSRMELFEGGHGFLNEDPRAYERVIAFLKGELGA